MQGELLGGSWVVISGVFSRVTILITHIRGLITPLITTPIQGELLGGSWVVISGVIGGVTILITHIRGLYNATYNYPYAG